jgi:hypothetical protein
MFTQPSPLLDITNQLYTSVQPDISLRICNYIINLEMSLYYKCSTMLIRFSQTDTYKSTQQVKQDSTANSSIVAQFALLRITLICMIAAILYVHGIRSKIFLHTWLLFWILCVLFEMLNYIILSDIALSNAVLNTMQVVLLLGCMAVVYSIVCFMYVHAHWCMAIVAASSLIALALYTFIDIYLTQQYAVCYLSVIVAAAILSYISREHAIHICIATMMVCMLISPCAVSVDLHIIHKFIICVGSVLASCFIVVYIEHIINYILATIFAICCVAILIHSVYSLNNAAVHIH